MISVQEVVQDPDMTSPSPFTIQRSTGSWDSGGFVSTITETILCWGPVHNTGDKELAMIPQADKISEALTFWCTVPIYVTQGYASVPAVHPEIPLGTFPGSIYTLSMAPPSGMLALYWNGLLQRENIDFTVIGNVITLKFTTSATDKLACTWPITAQVQPAAIDIILYGDDQYRILQVHKSLGGGYYRAVGQRLSAA